jgi:hypothetical protein
MMTEIVVAKIHIVAGTSRTGTVTANGTGIATATGTEGTAIVITTDDIGLQAELAMTRRETNIIETEIGTEIENATAIV